MMVMVMEMEMGLVMVTRSLPSVKIIDKRVIEAIDLLKAVSPFQSRISANLNLNYYQHHVSGSINSSLFVLGNVINSLNAGHVCIVVLLNTP